jgi:predicted CXXCH cytochrome family protein
LTDKAKPSKHLSYAERKAAERERARRRRKVLWITVLSIIAVVALFGIGSFTFAASMEEKDSFCASCHTEPESTYYARGLQQTPTDLATFHQTKQNRCIDCHSGVGVTGRLVAMAIGARNAAAYFTKTARQPAPLLFPIGDGNCVKCHAEVTRSTDFNQHFHAYLTRWQAADPKAASCVSCHTGHAADGDSSLQFLNRARAEAICQNCHQVLGGGD